jgi:hypothetical protein
MNNNMTYIALGAIAVIYFFYKVIPFLRKAKKITKGLFSKIYLNSNSNLTQQQYRKIAIGAIYSEQQTAFINSLDTGLGKSETKKMLSEWWEINTSQQAHEQLTYLQNKGHRFYFPTVTKAFFAPEEIQENIIVENFSNEEDLEKAFSQLYNLKEVIKELKEDGIIVQETDITKYGSTGWDCGRLVFLTRLCYSCGYINETEAWSYIDKAASLAKSSFTSWKDFSNSYILGRGMWGGLQSANSGIATIAKYLLELKNSPWVEMAW